jgi:hypothetical protein
MVGAGGQTMSTLTIKPKTMADIEAENVRRCREPKPARWSPGMITHVESRQVRFEQEEAHRRVKAPLSLFDFAKAS